MKMTEKIQQALSGRRQSPPATNGRVGDSARKRSSRAALLVGLGIIFAGLLITVTVISGGLQGGARPDEQVAAEGGICDLISAQIADLVRTWEGTAHISVERAGNGYTLTSGRIVLILRSYQSGVSLDEIIEVQDKIEARALIELGEPPFPIVKAVPGGDAAPIVAYGFAIGDDWVGVGFTYHGGRGELPRIHQEALVWFKQQFGLPAR